MSPSPLDHPDALVLQRSQKPPKNIGSRNEVCVEDEEEVPRGDPHACGQSTGLEAAAIGPPQLLDVDPLALPVIDALGHDERGAVVGVVEDLDFEPITWVVQSAARIDHPRGDRLLVVHGELDRDSGQLRVGPRRANRIPPLPGHPEQPASMSGKRDEHRKECGGQRNDDQCGGLIHSMSQSRLVFAGSAGS